MVPCVALRTLYLLALMVVMVSINLPRGADG